MKHIWSILCLRSITDQGTNTISLIDSFEQLTVLIDKDQQKGKKEIKINMPFEIVSFITREENNTNKIGDLQIELIRPGIKTKKIDSSFELKKGYKRIRVQTRFGGFKLGSGGIYLFRIKLKDGKQYKTVAELPLEVEFKKSDISKSNL